MTPLFQKFEWVASAAFCKNHMAIFDRLTQESGQSSVTGMFHHSDPFFNDIECIMLTFGLLSR